MTVQSMTGYGMAENEACKVEVRSVNHRFLDIYFRSPSFLNQSEIPMRNILKENFARGKFDVNITVPEIASSELNINTDAVRRIYGAFKKLQEELKIKGEMDINTFVNLHEMFVETNPKYDLDAVISVFRQALAALSEMRTREGEALAAELLAMSGSLLQMKGAIKAMSGQAAEAAKVKFGERLKTILEGQEVEEGRLLQEAALIAAKLDISEEIARIESHLKQFSEILREGGIIGRKLDFILQELNREVNTIASKSADYEVSRITVDMKTEIEKMREQVQNIQ